MASGSYPNWDPSNEITDAQNAEDLFQQPDSTEESKEVEITVPNLLGNPSKLKRCKTKLRKNFNINTIEEKADNVITVTGYGFTPEQILQTVQRYDSEATAN